MATYCPVCNKGTLKVGDKLVYCSDRVVEKVGNDFIDKGCLFKVNFDQKKVYGDVLTPGDIKALVEGKTLTSKKGHSLVLDLNNTFFTKITFAEKKADKDL
jgi:hypothetical protein